MDEKQLNRLRGIRPDPQVVGPDAGGDRTLLYGYDVNRRTFHLYQKDGELHLVVYSPSEKLTLPKDDPARWVIRRYEHGPFLDVAVAAPNKRLYPEACDAEFCERLIRAGAHLAFIDHDPKREVSQFYGLVVTGEPALVPSA